MKVKVNFAKVWPNFKMFDNFQLIKRRKILKLYWTLLLMGADCCVPPETEMALAHFGRPFSHPPRVPLEAVFNSLKAGIGGIWEKQRPESARVIWKSIYYAKMTKIVNLGLDQQFSPNNKVFFLNRYFQKKCCSFSFLRPKFSLGMLFRQFGNFPMSSCGPTV